MGASPAIELERGLDVGCGVVMVRAVGGECGADIYGYMGVRRKRRPQGVWWAWDVCRWMGGSVAFRGKCRVVA